MLTLECARVFVRGRQLMKLLFLGAGAVVSEFYLPAIAWLGAEWKVTIADRSEDTLANLREKADWVQTLAADYATAIKSSTGFDAAVVALPNWLHYDACKKTIAAGLPTLCEKPLSLSSQECQELDQLARQADVPLEVAMVRRLTPANQAAAAILNSGAIGQLKQVVVDHGAPYAWASTSGAFFRRENGGTLADLGVHHLDWLASLLGPLKAVGYSDDSLGGVEASFDYQLQTRTGVPVDVRCTYRRNLSNTTRFVGERATIVVDRSNFTYCEIEGLVDGAKVRVDAAKPFDDDQLPHTFESCFVQQLLDFERVVSRKKPVRVSAGEAAEVIALIESAYQSRPVRTSQVSVTSDVRPGLEPAKTLVTGGSGFIGGHLLERLANLGFEDLVVPVRGFKTCVNAARFPVSLPKLDLSSREQIRSAMQGVRWCFHLAYGQTEKDMRDITVGGTKVLVEEAVRAGVETVVVLSTMGVFGSPTSDRLVDESFGYDPAYGEYGKTKAEMEQWLLAQKDKSGKTRIVVLNPTCVYGPDGKTYSRMPYEMATQQQFAWVEGGQGICNYVFVDNLIDAILHTAKLPAAHGQRFLVNDGYCTWKEFLTPLLLQYGATVADWSMQDLQTTVEVRVPPARTADIVRHLTRDYQFLDLVNRHPALKVAKSLALRAARPRLEKVRRTKLEYRDTSNGSVSSSRPPAWLIELFGPTTARFSSKKLRDLGWAPQVDLSMGLARTANWLVQAGIASEV